MTDKNKLIIGKWIGNFRKYYDSKTRSNKWGQEKFILYEGEPICSVKTLSHIENGQEIAKDEVYELLLRKLNTKFNENQELDEELDRLISGFYEAIKFYDREKAEQVVMKLRQFPESDSFYYKQIIESMLFIMDFEFDNIHCKELDYYCVLAESMESEQMAFLTAAALFCTNNESDVLQGIVDRAYEVIENLTLQDELRTEFKAMCYLAKDELFEAYRLLEKCCKKYIEIGNDFRHFKLYLRYMYIETLIDLEHALGLIPELEKQRACVQKKTDEKQLHYKRLSIENSLMLCIIYFTNRNYAQTIECAMTVFELDSRLLCKVSPYYFSSMEHLEREIKDLGVEKIYLEKSEKHYYIFYRYYILKHVDKADELELLNYLLKRVVPAIILGVYGKMSMYIMEYEVQKLVVKTRRYKYLVDFHTLLFDLL